MELRTLFIEDNEQISNNLRSYFDGENFSGHILKTENTIKFEEGISFIEHYDYDLIVLDLYKDGTDVDETAGIKVLEKIRSIAFVPIIFFTGHSHKIQNLKSEVVGVVNKGDGFESLKEEIQRIVDSRIALLKGQVYNHLRESLRQYFWETVHDEKKFFEPVKNDISLGYLLLRRFSNSLSKENIKHILGDNKITIGKAHPMEFYIFPSSRGEFEAGEILEQSKESFVVLTPSCDFIERVKRDGSKERKVGYVLLAKIIPLQAFGDYKAFKINGNKENTNKLISLISNNQTDRYFFLPGTPFIENGIIDFQNKIMVDYSRLEKFQRVAKLDDPYAQSMVSSFIRYYNRIGFPDIDSDYVIKHL